MQDPVDIRRLFMLAPRAELAEDLVADLLELGVRPGEISVFAGRADFLGVPKGVRVSMVRRPADAAWRGGLAGAGLGLALGLAVWTLAGDLTSAVAALALGVASGSVIAVLLSTRRTAGTLGPLRPMVEGGDLVVDIRVPKSRLDELEGRVKAEHPDVQILGTDPGGSPPFP
ncbi:MAG: hypothetical protein PVF91_11760 [Chromatiales bacterium]|jgi:hypothetical protein